MGKRYLIDTNVISHLFSNSIPDKGAEFVKNVINDNFIISVVVEIEVLTYHESSEKMRLIEEFMHLADIIPLDKEITVKTIELRRKHKKLKLGDAIIAATAIVHKLILISNNLRDFSNIKDLQVIDVHTL